MSPGPASSSRDEPDRGSASIWVLACCSLVLAVAFAGTVRATAVLVRHRAESAADLAALAAAGQIGVTGGVCVAAARTAAANGASILRCQPLLGPSGRSGSVTVSITMRVTLPVVGAREVAASARAGRVATEP
ncbi:MAG: pilus assembly protein TadG-related protein [Actinomycetota bacterium]|nr:pilus assembly protein TadG-related protein [Actinomycetota bacterium]